MAFLSVLLGSHVPHYVRSEKSIRSCRETVSELLQVPRNWARIKQRAGYEWMTTRNDPNSNPSIVDKIKCRLILRGLAKCDTPR